MDLPAGTITFLFTDIEGSTRLWERHPVPMGTALARHDAILRAAVGEFRGHIFKTVGDAFCVAFHTALDGLQAAARAQIALQNEPWGETGPLRVRMALHTGAAELRDGDYFGNPLNRVARILSASHGGQVLLSLPVEELVRDLMTGGLTLRDLGERRLRDLKRPERLYQAIIPGVPSEFPPLRSVEVMPNNLPVNLSTFVGREREIANVKSALTVTRLLTLTGTGGTGKTRLSLQVAVDVLPDFPDGVWFVELAAVSDPSRVVDTVAAAMDIREDPDLPMRTTLTRALAQRQTLVILDNCEHLHAACVDLAGELLRHCPKVKLLATSRHSLGISGERTLAVPPLSTINPARDIAPGQDWIATISQYESVRLFIDRAASVKPGFEVTAQNAPAIAQICWRLDGIPLAIELAAARARVLTPDQIAARLDDRFRLLTGGNRSVLPHQQTLRTLIDWSYDLLSESERVIFRRLGVFGGGRTLEAIETVCTGDGVDAYDALDLLQQLVDKSLIAVEASPDDSQRYTMIESVWQYAREKLRESGELDVLRDRHLDYFLAIAEAAAPGLEGPDVADWLERVDAERNNFRLALEWTATSPERAGRGLRMAGLLIRYWEIRGHMKEGRHYLSLVLHAPGNESASTDRALALSGAGRIAWLQDLTQEAKAHYSEAVAMFDACGDGSRAALNRAFFAFNIRNEGRDEEARELFNQVLEFGRGRNDPLLAAIALSGLGSVATSVGDSRLGRRLKEESLAIYRSVGDKWVTGYLLWGLAKSCVSDGDAVQSRIALNEWASIALELRNRWVVPYLLTGYADTVFLEGNAAASARLLGASTATRNALGLTLDLADQQDWDASINRARAHLGDEGFEREFHSGSELSLWEAVDYGRSLEPLPA